MSDTKSQNAAILEHLKMGRRITPLSALAQFKCLRLAARINDLRDLGHRIECEKVKLPGGKRVAEYRLAELVS